MARLQDTLLKAAGSITSDTEYRQAVQGELAMLKAEFMALDELIRSVAWPTVLAKLKADETDILVKLEMCTDSTVLAKLVGSLLACRGQMAWPQRRKDDLEQAIKDLEIQLRE